jgi:erythromycin esterase-like protein
MGDHGELNVGQLVRERHAKDVLLLGFTTYTGSVTAASDWDGPVERKIVRPALNGSYEALFHETGVPRFLLILRDNNWLSTLLNKKRLERAIGVIYLPETERASHYFEARLADQFDAVIHLDETRAVEPLERMRHEPSSRWSEHLNGRRVRSYRRPFPLPCNDALAEFNYSERRRKNTV